MYLFKYGSRLAFRYCHVPRMLKCLVFEERKSVGADTVRLIRLSSWRFSHTSTLSWLLFAFLRALFRHLLRRSVVTTAASNLAGLENLTVVSEGKRSCRFG
jgi:hypothetical protein